MSSPSFPKHLPELDGIRAIAALMVMIFHFVGHHNEPAIIRQIAVMGQTGVDLFFVLSGFLITRILVFAKGSKHYFASFYARRILRIFPLYYGFLCIFFFIVPYIFSTSISPFNHQIWAWLYLENIPATFTTFQSSGPLHFWSLAVEEHFYLIWPLVVFFCSRRYLYIVVTSILVLSPFIRAIFLNTGIGVFYFSLTRFDSIAFGALLALLTIRNHSIDSRPLTYLIRASLLLFPLILLPMFVLFSGSQYDWLQIVKLSLIPAFYWALIGFCVLDPKANMLNKFLSVPILRWLGKISYGLYVFHPICFEIIHRFITPHSFFTDVALSFGITIVIAFLSFHFFESPILQLKNRFQYQLNITNHDLILQENQPILPNDMRGPAI